MIRINLTRCWYRPSMSKRSHRFTGGRAICGDWSLPFAAYKVAQVAPPSKPCRECLRGGRPKPNRAKPALVAPRRAGERPTRVLVTPAGTIEVARRALAYERDGRIDVNADLFRDLLAIAEQARHPTTTTTATPDAGR